MRLIGLILAFFIFFACTGKQERKSENQKVETQEKQHPSILVGSDVNRLEVQPDTLIQGFLALNNYSYSERFNDNLTSKNQVEFLRESPVFIFSSKHKSEYLLAYQYEGATKGEFSCFEIGYRSDLETTHSSIGVELERFVLESGVQLGLTLEELLKIKGNNYRKDKDTVVYAIEDYVGSTFLKQQNSPGYFLKCTFKNDKINTIRFGFEYP